MHLRVRYDNTSRGNSFDQERLTALVRELEAAAAHPDCSVIRLDMAGDNFCGGWDTTTFKDLAAAGRDVLEADLRTCDGLLGRIRRLPVPVVSGVRGKVLGFGVGLLSAIHLPLASADVRLSLPEARFGFAPAGVGHTVAQTLPRAHAYAVLTGTVATAQQLLDWGLVARVVPDASLDSAVDDLTESLASIPGGALRGVVEVVESSLATGRPDLAYQVSARTILDAAQRGEQR